MKIRSKFFVLFLICLFFLLPFSLKAESFVPGQAVEVLWKGVWFKAEIEKLLDEDLYRVKFYGEWKNQNETVAAERLRKPPVRQAPDWSKIKKGEAVEIFEFDHWRPALFVEIRMYQALLRYADGLKMKEDLFPLSRVMSLR